MATPRSSADAVPLLILAKDLLRRLVSKEITFFDDRAGVLEARVRQLESNLAEAAARVEAAGHLVLRLGLEPRGFVVEAPGAE